MPAPVKLRAFAVAAAALLTLGLTSCGGDDTSNAGTVASSQTGRGVVHIYSSLRGAPAREKESMEKAMRLARDSVRERVGSYEVRWRELNRSTNPAGTWTVEQVAADARKAAQDPRAVGYIGEFASEASRIAIPILNLAGPGIATLSPASTAAGLTTDDDPGGPKADPGRNYPTRIQTFMRLIPRDTVQAAALVAAMKQDGCKKVALAHDAGAAGSSLARMVDKQAKDAKLDLASNVAYTPGSSARTIATTFEEQNADCFLMTASRASAAARRLFRAVASTLPKARLYASGALCDRGFTAPGRGMSETVAKRYACTLPTLPLKEYEGGRTFLKNYRRKWRDETPTPHAIYAYEAMKRMLDTIASLGPAGNSRIAVLAALLSTSEQPSVLGTYSFTTAGDTTRTDYGLYHVGRNGAPTWVRTLRPQVG